MNDEVKNNAVGSEHLLDGAGTLQEFAECADAVAATTKKLQKAAILGEYLKTLSDPDLSRAARYFAGHQFASTDARTTNVGGSIISAALSEATGFSPEDLYPRYVRLGDPGELAAEIIQEAKRFSQPTITLAETESLITRLSETRGIKNKTALLAAVLHRASPLDMPTFIARLFLGPSLTGHRRVTGFTDASDLRVRSRDGRPVPLEVDGDWLGDVTEADFGITPGGLSVIA